MKNLLFVSETVFYGGGEKFLEILISFLEKDNINFVVSNKKLFLSISANVGALKVLKIEMTSRLNKLLSALLVIRFVKCKQISKIVLNGLPSLIMLVASIFTKRKIYIIVHTATWNYYGKLIWPLYRLLIEKYCTLVYVAEHLQCSAPIFTKRDSYVLHNRLINDGYDPPKFLPSENISRILFVGRGSKSKGIYEFLDVASKASEFQFYIAGEIIEKDVLVRIKSLSNVKSLGYLKNIDQLLNNFDLAVFPSHSEGFPYSVLEAARAGLPIITSDIPAHREICMLVGPFPLFTVFDSDSLLEKIIEINNLQKRKKLSNILYLNFRSFNNIENYRRDFNSIFLK